MTITLKLSSEQEQRLRAGAAQQDARTVREVLRQAADSKVEELLRSSTRKPNASTLPALLDKIAAGFRDAPVLSDEAVSRAGIYADHP
jgi:vacuolar-type H+-ATPase subunit E/Vma4